MIKNVLLSTLIFILIAVSSGWAADETITFEPTIVSSTTVKVKVKASNQDDLKAINFALKYSDGLKFEKAHFKNSRVKYFDFNCVKKLTKDKNIIIYGGIWQFSPKPVEFLPGGTGLITTLIFEIIDPAAEIWFEETKTSKPNHQALFVYESIINNQIIVHPKVNITPSSYITSINNTEDLVPLQFELFQNYPNPFNPITTIAFTLPATAHVELTIYNIYGQLVKSLVSAQLPAGMHKINWDIGAISSGIYFYKITTKDFSATKKMVVLK